MKLQLEIMDVVTTDTYISMQRVKFIIYRSTHSLMLLSLGSGDKNIVQQAIETFMHLRAHPFDLILVLNESMMANRVLEATGNSAFKAVHNMMQCELVKDGFCFYLKDHHHNQHISQWPFCIFILIT